MFIKLLVVFIVVPLVELFVLLEVGSMIGAFPTIALIILTGISGAYLARTQGFDLLRRIQSEMEQGRLPTEDLLDGAMVLAGGIVLLTPGFCTDLLGFILLVPFTRAHVKRIARLWFLKQVNRGNLTIRRF
ncbi:FxsA family protein [uncultured Desulfuromonas sp.]|uniref:FxsA family protein n=1 Tax=uncultured Desulfuromonas sp. TaxID=181013 RepID=UPI00263403BA|nr:FxsA family protein [uncultured Desulfuromonas sp.]